MYEALPTNLGCHNLSTTFLATAAHRTLLANGVKFVPTPDVLSNMALEKELDGFVRRTRWRAVFGGSDNNNVAPPLNNNNGAAKAPAAASQHRPQMPALYRATGTVPPLADDGVEAWLGKFTAYVRRLGEVRLCNRSAQRNRLGPLPSDPHLRHFNLPYRERLALTALRNSTRFTRVTHADGSTTWTPPRLVIANADKNLGLTVMDYDWFHRECLRQLYNRDFYRELPERLARARIRAAFQHLTRLVHAGRLVHDLAQVVPAPRRLCRAQRFLLSRPPTHAEHRVPSFRIIPKVHKTPVAGRPITPAHRYLFSPANEFITQVLHPLVSLVPEILRDSNQLLFELEDAATLDIHPGDEIYLVTGDVESLYTNIPRTECLDLLRQLPIPAFVLDLLWLVFNNCIVRFAELWFEQHDGFPMGIEPAPDVANLFMWLLVRRLGAPPPQLRLYRRLIDDLFIVWVGSRASLEAHLVAINALHRRIRVTWTVSDRTADFLDLHLHLGERFYDGQGRLDVTMHQKRLNCYLYIPALSFHKRSQHRAWIKAELLRILRNSSSAVDYKRMRRVFFARLVQRGHSVSFLREVFSGAFYAHSNRDSLLSALQARQDRAYAKAVDVVSRCITEAPLDAPLRLAYDAYVATRVPRAPGARFYATPWLSHASPGPEALLLDPETVAAARTRDYKDIFEIFTRDSPPPAFFLPLTSATAGLRWGTLTLTLTRDPLDSASTPEVRDRELRRDPRRILLVLRRPPSLGSRLRFVNPAHAHPEPGPPVPPPAPAPKGAAAPPPPPPAPPAPPTH